MRNRGRARRAGRSLTGLAGSQNGHIVVSITEGGLVGGGQSAYAVVTLAGHGLIAGQTITFSGIGVGFDTARTVSDYISATEFWYHGISGSGSATGGRWD